MFLKISEKEIRLVDSNQKVVVEDGVLVEGEGLCAIYVDEAFIFVCTSKSELDDMLEGKDLFLTIVSEKRLCSNCEMPMQEGFYFESDGTQYCSEKCLTTIVSWETYLQIYDQGNGEHCNYND